MPIEQCRRNEKSDRPIERAYQHCETRFALHANGSDAASHQKHNFRRIVIRSHAGKFHPFSEHSVLFFRDYVIVLMTSACDYCACLSPRVGVGGDEGARKKHLKRKKMLARDRVDALVDPGYGS